MLTYGIVLRNKLCAKRPSEGPGWRMTTTDLITQRGLLRISWLFLTVENK